MTTGVGVLGLAIWTPLGDLRETLDALLSHVAGGVPHERRHPSSTNPRASANRTVRLLGPLPALAVEVARAAAADLPAGERTGVFLATGGLRAHWDDLGPAMAEQVADAHASWSRGLRRLHPLWMLRYLSNGAQAAIANELGLLGDGATFAGAASAASAIIAAHAAIACGAIDHALIVALDDLTAAEVAVELSVRHPALIPGAGVAAIAVSGGPAAVRLSAADGIAGDAEPSDVAIAAVRARLASVDRDLHFMAQLGYLGAASPLVDAAIAAHFLATGWPAAFMLGDATAVTCTAAASPGQIGVIRIAQETRDV